MSPEISDPVVTAHDAVDDISASFVDYVNRKPVQAALGAAAAGAGLMALLALLARDDTLDPRKPLSTASSRGLDYQSLKNQLADLADRVSRSVPTGEAKQRVGDAGDAIAEGWSHFREQTANALGRFEPEASAAIRVARDNPVWTAVIVGAVSALVGAQMLGKTPAADADADAAADAPPNAVPN